MRKFGLLALGAALASCGTPFVAGVNDYDLSHEQAKASVLFSDPQVYSRETLVNDRRIEIRFLGEQLKASETATFAPQLKRDLQTLATFVAQLDGTSNPGGGNQYDRDQAKADLQQQIDLSNAQKALTCASQSLLIEQRRLDALSKNEAAPAAADTSGLPATTCPTVPAATGGVGGSPPPPTTPDDLASVKASLAAARLLLDDLNKSATTHTAGTGQTPQEQFRDRQTFREEIRAALADVNLDDGHDMDGNALYRLQFRATVLPGANPGQFAIGRMTFSAPTMDRRDVADLYLSWLSYVNKEINKRPTRDAFSDDDAKAETGRFGDELRMIGAYSGMFDLLELTDGSRSVVAEIAMPPDVVRYARHIIRCQTFAAPLNRYITPKASEIFFGNVLPVCDAKEVGVAPEVDATSSARIALKALSVSDCPTDADISLLTYTVADLEKPARFPAMVLAAGSAAAAGGVSTHAQQNARLADLAIVFRTDLDRVQAEILKRGTEIAKEVEAHFPKCSDPAAKKRLTEALWQFSHPWNSVYNEHPDDLVGPLLDIFQRFIRTSEGADYTIVPRGEAAAFFARPIDESQRISTMQSASNAVDLAMALRTQMNGSGIFGSLGANYVRQSAGRIEAVERSPIVVGFNDHATAPPCEEGKTTTCEKSTWPQAGWVFGPTLMPGSTGETLERRQIVVNRSVSTDVSLPGWWPRVRVKVESAWVGNWTANADGNALKYGAPAAGREFDVSLPKNATDMLALTRLVSGLGRPLTTPEITSVTPRHVVLCPGAPTLHIQVEGRNVWRGAEAYLNGVPADSVRILPNMGGLDLQFPTANLPLRPTDGKGVGPENGVIVVWTRDDEARAGIVLERSAPDANFCKKSDDAGDAGDIVRTSTDAGDGLSFPQMWIAPGAKFAVVMKDRSSLAANRIETRVEMQKYDAVTKKGVGVPFVLATESASQLSTDDAKGIVSLTTPPAIAGFDDGGPVAITVITKSRNGTETRTGSEKLPIFYSNADQSAIDGTAAISVAAGDTPFSVTVTMPQKPNVRYPKLPVPETPPTIDVMSLQGTLKAAGVTYVFASSGGWTFSDYAPGGRPRYAITMKLSTPGDAAALMAAIGKEGQAQFILKVDGQQTASQLISIKPK